MDFWELLLSDFDIKLMVFARILGIFSFNPILSRSNIPARVRVGLSLLTAYIVALALPPMEFDAGNTVGQYVLSFAAELFIGVVLGFIFDLFIYMIYMAGDIMDSQAGLGMAKVFDPSTRIQLSMYGAYMGYFMFLYFFAANAHLTLIRIFVDSFEVIPLGGGQLSPDLGWTIVSMFSQILVLMIQLAMPVIATELIVECCIGILMKTVPQIQIMVVNIQLRVIMGFIVLFAITSPLSEFIADYTEKMLNTCREMLPLLFT
ncbi:MAG: flagellar biosynthetic protein FliR [Huintestinicola sp.]